MAKQVPAPDELFNRLPLDPSRAIGTFSAQPIAAAGQAIKGGAQELSSGAQQFARGTERYAIGTEKLAQGEQQNLQGNEQYASGMSQLGAGMEKVGNGVDAFLQDQQRYQFATAQADLLQKTNDLNTSFIGDTDYSTRQQRYNDAYKGIVGDVSQNIDSPFMRDRFVAHAAQIGAEANYHQANTAFKQGNDAQLAGILQREQDVINTTAGSPDELIRRNGIDEINNRIDAAVNAGSLDPLKAFQEKRRFANQYVGTTVDAFIQQYKNAPSVEAGMESLENLRKAIQSAPFLSDQPAPGGVKDEIKKFEGFDPRAKWDFKQYTNGYGTKASGPGEVIDQNTAEQRLDTEVSQASSFVDTVNPNLPAGVKAALTSLTFNAGGSWAKGGLGDSIRNGDFATAKKQFVQYNQSGGQVNPGLVNRRNQEVQWFDQNDRFAPQQNTQVAQNDQTQSDAGGPAVPQQPTSYSIMSLDQRVKAYNRIDQAEKALRTTAASNLNDRVTDTLAEAQGTGDVKNPMTQQEFTTALGPKDGPDAYTAYQDRLQLNSSVYKVAGMSPQEQADFAKAHEPTPGEVGYADNFKLHNAILGAINKANKAKAADPAAFAAQYAPAATDAFNKFTSVMADPTAGNDVKGAAARDLQNKMTIEQQRLGVPQDKITMLPKAYAQAAAQHVMDAPDPVAAFKQVKDQFGPAWSQAYKDMVVEGKMPAQYQSIAVLPNPRDGSLLARWIRETPKDKTADDILGRKPATDIKTAVMGNSAVQSLIHSLSMSGSSNAQVDSVLHSINQLGYAKYFYDRDPQAAQNAVKAFTDQYSFDMPGSPRVPTESASTVSANANAILSRLDENSVAVPAIFGTQGHPAKSEYISGLKASPTWVTNPDGNAVWLMDNGGRFVRGRDGNRIAVPFNSTLMHEAMTDNASMGSGPYP